MILREAPQLYFDPLDSDVGSIVVSRVAGSQEESILNRIARRSTYIINHSLKAQLTGTFSETEIDQVSDPKNADHVTAQTERLKASSSGDAVFVNATILSRERSLDLAEDVVGIGYLTLEDRRPANSRKQRPDPPASRNLAVVRGLYVLPDWGATNFNLQRHGIGSTILHYMLKSLDRNMPVEVVDYFEVNSTLVPVIEERLGLEPIREINGKFAGKPAKQMVWGGRNCGEIVATLESKRPWQGEPVRLRSRT